ncbi:MAG TPA: endopeptidase La [Chloroflexi bacterium]|nr:endopeptidase La [Chloroflexota bacterium]
MFSWSNITENEDGEEKEYPEEISILALRGTVAFPHIIMPLVIGLEHSIELIDDAIDGDEYIGLAVSQAPEKENPKPEEVHPTGVIATIHRRLRSKDGSLQIIVQGVERFKVTEWTQKKPYLKAKIAIVHDTVDDDKLLEIEALRRRTIDLSREIVRFMPQVPEEAVSFLESADDPHMLLYTVAANTRMEHKERLAILEKDDLGDKMRYLLKIMSRELEVLQLSQKIQSETQGELDSVQREYYLRQQLKAIKKELGEGDETEVEVHDYKEKFEEVGLPEEALKEANRELSRLQKLPPQAAEYGVIKTYLDWLTELPWNALTEDNLDIEHARQVLDADHYGLEKIKERILEYLAVRKLRKERDIDDEDIPEQDRAGGSILLFVGPPGVGKTSLGRSIARSLDRKFTRMSLGGVRDEAEIRGHRRTYIGAMPGRIIQALKRAESRNPVFMLDEVDKVGSDWRGDPSSALLEVLDPQQNHAFRDHYLDVDFDLSNIMFIATANTLETIPHALRDRMEIIHLDGYTEFEKVEIAKGYLIPRQVKTKGLMPEEIPFTHEGIRQIIRDYTRESGVRTLERQIGKVARKVAVKIADGKMSQGESETITPKTARKYLGKPRFYFEAALRTEKPGVATGLAWTPVGGDVLFIEASCMSGKDRLILTGQLGDVMKESAQIALSYVRSNLEQFNIDPELFNNTDIHLHVPAGAIPKDGPSAGVTLATALVSLFTKRSVRSSVGMTGEISLQGQVLPIGGLKQKVLAAHRAGLTTIIHPKRNEADLEDVPEDVRKEITFITVETIDDVLKNALQAKPASSAE